MGIEDKSGALSTAEKALTIAKTLAEKQEKLDNLLKIANIQFEADDRSASLATFQLAEKTRLATQEPGWPNSYSYAIRGLAMVSEYEKAIQLAAESGDLGLSSLGNMAQLIIWKWKTGKEPMARDLLLRIFAILKKRQRTGRRTNRDPLTR